MIGTKRRIPSVLALLSLSIAIETARADQLFLVTEYACHPKEQLFLLTTHAFDSEDGQTDSTPGLHKMPYGTARISCNLGNHKLRAVIDVSGRPLQGSVAEGETTIKRI